MLIITRKIGESVAIGEDVVIKVIGVQGRKVQLGVEAPESVRVTRVDDASGAPQDPQTD